MGLLWNRKRAESDKKALDSTREVVRLKEKASKTADQADRDITKLNDLLLENGVTLLISIAAGGKRGH